MLWNKYLSTNRHYIITTVWWSCYYGNVNSAAVRAFSTFLTMDTMLYVFFWVIPRRLNFICQRFGTLCLFHPHRQVRTYTPMNMEQKSVPKRRHIKFGRRGITQKKAYNIQNTAKVWNQEWTPYNHFSRANVVKKPSSSHLTLHILQLNECCSIKSVHRSTIQHYVSLLFNKF
jgi:hypothetical protein